MDLINYVLDDESNNDKQLVKELSIYVRNHAKNNLPINKKFVKDIISIISINSEIDYNAINFNAQNYAAWNSKNKTLSFNITKIIRASNEKLYYKSRVEDSNILSYFVILTTIIHEITHARQQYVMQIRKNEIYSSCENLIEIKYDVYDEKHDEVLIERYANIRGEMLAYQVISYIFPYRNIKFLQSSICEYLLCGYVEKEDGIISAIDTYNFIMEENGFPKVNIDYGEDIDLYSRLYLGLSITKEEYDKIMDLYDEIYDGKSKKEDIKKLINRL